MVEIIGYVIRRYCSLILWHSCFFGKGVVNCGIKGDEMLPQDLLGWYLYYNEDPIATKFVIM